MKCDTRIKMIDVIFILGVMGCLLMLVGVFWGVYE